MNPASDWPAPGIETIAAAAYWARDRYRDAPALVEDGRVVSFTDYVGEAARIARVLIAHAVQPGERVAIWAPNSIDFALCALAVHLSGAVLVPINTRFKAREAAQVLRDADAKVLFTVESFLGSSYVDALRQLRDREPDALPHMPLVFTLGGCGDGSLAAAIEWGTSQVPPEIVDERVRGVRPDDIGTVLFTSGTTGRPKGAMLRHGALVRSYWVWSGITGLREGDRFLVSNPFFHAFGLKVGLLAALMRGATVYPLAVFSASVVLELIERERITYYPGPPTIYQSLLAAPDLLDRDISSLRTAVTGATSIPPQLIGDIYDKLGYDEVYIPYGFTEGTGVATLTRAGDNRATIATTSGRALPGVHITVRRADGTTAAAGEVGEITLAGFNVMAGYLDPATGSPRPADDNGWLRSGDLGALDEIGNLSISGRLKDVVIVGGFNVYPAEVEACLVEHPGVTAAAVVGIPDVRLGEVTCAFVVARPHVEVTVGDLELWCRERIANFKVPREFRFVPELPTNASGKVVKAALRESMSADLSDI
ncbi:AMP-binding protein [Nocardia sp. NPDC050378]|uniref:AMP-binding protein n=1 Tax=Nocardia sp. NPDC050378 TaxID=3155400 RepID=UPI0033FCA984